MAISNELRRLVDPNNECCCEHCLSIKCKEWAYINGYNVIDYKIGKKELDVFIIKADKNDFNKVEKIFYHNSTLVEAIIKACDWILKELNENR